MKREAALVPEAERLQALASLFAALQAEPRTHDFFAVLRRVESLRPDLPRFGQAPRPSQEALRLGQEPELDFAPAALASFEPRAAAAPRLGVRFFGLLGPQGPMPLHFTEYVRERLRFRGDATAARFLDVFHHRLLALFYRAWAQAQPTVQHDRPEDDRYAAWLGASCGAQESAGSERALPDSARLFQAGLLGARSRHAEGLTKLLANHFGVPVRIEQHVAQWLALDRRDRTQLGFARNRRERGASAAGALGVGAGCGSRLRDRQYKFRVVLGPLTLAQYEAFLPGGAAWPGLSEWVQDYAGPDLRWDVRLTLDREHVPPPRLGASLRLGVATWIGRVPRPRERGDLRLRPHTSFLLQHHGGRHA